MLIMKQIMLLLKKENVMTLGCLFSLANYLENIVHDRWLGAPMISSPFLDIKLGIVQIIDQGGF